MEFERRTKTVIMNELRSFSDAVTTLTDCRIDAAADGDGGGDGDGGSGGGDNYDDFNGGVVGDGWGGSGNDDEDVYADDDEQYAFI